MKKLVLAIAGTLAFAGSANAADLPPPPAAVEPEPAFSWVHTIYVGVQGGYGIGYKDWIYESPAGDNSHQVRGWLAGVQGGINVQRNNFVIGAEVDWNWSNITGSAECPAIFTCSSDINWLVTWTGRAGWMAGPVLIYAEGGLAFANETFVDDVPGPGARSITVGNFGWTVGGGAEVRVGTAWAIDLEYSYVHFGTDFYSFGPGLPLLVTQSLHMVRLGVNRLF